MDVALRTLLRELALEVGDEIYDWLLRLLHGSYSRAEQKTIARTIVELARGHPAFDKIMRALAMILRILGIPMPSLAPAGTVVGGTAAGGAAAGGTGTGGAAAGGAGMTLGAALFMLAAIGVMSWRIYEEVTQEIDSGDVFGIPCSGGRLSKLMAQGLREHTVSNWQGRKDSMQDAIDAAWADAIRLRDNCDGTCPPGLKCLPSVAIQEIEQWAHFPYNTTYTRILFTLPCFCMLADDWWNQFRWDMLPEDVQNLWQGLGWEADSWEGETEPPKSSGKKFSELNAAEREAARALGYDETGWDAS